MRRKWKYITLQDLVNNQLCSMLEAEANKGWMFHRINGPIITFKKAKPQKIKYQLDFHTPDKEYKDLLESLDYQLVDNHRNFFIYKNNDISAPDLHSDDATRIQALISYYTLPHPILSIILFVFCLAMSLHYFTKIKLLPFILGSFYMHSTLYISFFGVLIVYSMIGLSMFQSIIVKKLLQRLLENKKSYLVFDKICHSIINFFTILLLILFISLFINLSIEYLFVSVLIFVGASILVYNLFYLLYHKLSYRITSDIVRKLFMLVIIGLLVIVVYQLESVRFQSSENITLQPYQTNYKISTQEKSLFLTNTTFGGSNDQDKTELEVFIQCNSSIISDAVFKYQIIYYEADTRIMESKNIDALVYYEALSYMGDNVNISYLPYENAIKTYQPFQSTLVDRCYYNEKYMIAKKDNYILVVQIDESNEISSILTHYFK